MIHYDAHEWGIYWKVRGSIFPRALLSALPSAALSFCIRYFELFTLELDDLKGSSVYSGFTFVLGFVLVFRTSQSYQRYWNAATAVHNMKAEWLNSCGSLIAFAQCSKQNEEEILQFSHIMIRLFGLLHAMALEEIAGEGEEQHYALLDIDGLRKDDLRVLTTPAAQGRKVEIVCQWIKMSILRSMRTGVLDVPAPILTRVFQELGRGLVNYHEAMQVVIWPFPFPYAQMSAVLIAVYMAVSPVVIAMGSCYGWYCFLATLISVVCMKGIDMIAVELENPFGSDPNDLPSVSMHNGMNRALTLLVNPQTLHIPQLREKAILNYNELMRWNEQRAISLREVCDLQERSVLTKQLRRMTTTLESAKSARSHKSNASAGTPGSRRFAARRGNNKYDRMTSFYREDWALNAQRTRHLLRIGTHDRGCSSRGLVSNRSDQSAPVSQLSDEQNAMSSDDSDGAPEDTCFPGGDASIEKIAEEKVVHPCPATSSSAASPPLIGQAAWQRRKAPSQTVPGHRVHAHTASEEMQQWRAARALVHGSCMQWGEDEFLRPEDRAPPWQGFLRDLSAQLRAHLSEQLAQQELAYERHLRAMGEHSAARAMQAKGLHAFASQPQAQDCAATSLPCVPTDLPPDDEDLEAHFGHPQVEVPNAVTS